MRTNRIHPDELIQKFGCDILKKHIQAGTIKRSDCRLLGLATDNVWTLVGDCYDRKGIERTNKYLNQYPTPDKW